MTVLPSGKVKVAPDKSTWLEVQKTRWYPLITMTYTDWGTNVTEKAPPADEVFDATALATANKKA